MVNGREQAQIDSPMHAGIAYCAVTFTLAILDLQAIALLCFSLSVHCEFLLSFVDSNYNFM